MSSQPPSPTVLVLQRDAQPVQTFALSADTITIGRTSDNDIVLDDSQISRHHARLTRRGAAWVLEDLGSRNGCHVNGTRISGPVALARGDRVELSDSIAFRLQAAVGMPPAVQHTPAPRTSVAWIIAPLVIAVALAVLLLAGATIYLRVQHLRRTVPAPPQVIVTAPPSAIAQSPGSTLLVLATAFGPAPIDRAELWLDDTMQLVQDSATAAGEESFYLQSSLLMPAGVHLLVVRAVDVHGLTGQSVPVALVGAQQSPPAETLEIVRSAPGDDLASIAASHGTQPEVLHALNPTLGDALPADAAVVVPKPTVASGFTGAAIQPPPVQPAGEPAPGTGGTTPAGPPLSPIPQAALPVLQWVSLGAIQVDPPAAPTDLQIAIHDCTVALQWIDHAANESAYQVWIAAGTLPPYVVASLAPAASGPVWFELPAPVHGPAEFWVEAVSLWGHAPSNIAAVTVDAACPVKAPTQLTLEPLDMHTGAQYDRLYAYVAIDGSPTVRLPADPSAFITLTGGQGDASGAPGAGTKWTVPIPPDGVLDLSGEWWGWAGQKLSKLGTFDRALASPTWDGTRQAIAGGQVELGVAVRPLGDLATGGGQTAYKYEDPTLAVPYELVESGYRSPGGDLDPQQRSLTWKWDGDAKKIDGFEIYLNDAPYNLGWLSGVTLLVEPGVRAADVHLPARCGQHVKWQITARHGEAESIRSVPAEYDQAECKLYAEVTFNWVEVGFADTGLPNLPIGGQHCDKFDTWFAIFANDRAKSYWGGNFFMPMTCGRTTFRSLTGWPDQYNFAPYNVPATDTLLVPLDGPKPTLRFGAQFAYDNFLGEQGMFGNHSPVPPIVRTRDEWAKFQQTFEYYGSQAPGSIKSGITAVLNVSVRGYSE